MTGHVDDWPRPTLPDSYADAEHQGGAASEPETPGTLTVLAGPTAVGKGTIAAYVRAHFPQVWLSVSMTTRTPRPGEVDGVHYHFVDDAEFDRLAAAGELLEHAVVHGRAKYGTPRGPVLRAMAQGMPEALFVFLAPPSWDELVHRLIGRGTETAEEQEVRLATARRELAAQEEFDRVVVNDDIRRASEELVSLMRWGRRSDVTPPNL